MMDSHGKNDDTREIRMPPERGKSIELYAHHKFELMENDGFPLKSRLY
jgi:hypothetical protein